MVVDPSRGPVLGMLVQVPGLVERIRQGRLIGYLILGVAALAMPSTLRLVFEEIVSMLGAAKSLPTALLRNRSNQTPTMDL